MSENEYPKAMQIGGGGWYVKWSDTSGLSNMPDEATARRCAASGKMLEALQSIVDGPQDDPAIDCVGEYEIGLCRGIEKNRYQKDGYLAAGYGHKNGVECALEWARDVAFDAIAAATPQTGGE